MLGIRHFRVAPADLVSLLQRELAGEQGLFGLRTLLDGGRGLERVARVSVGGTHLPGEPVHPARKALLPMGPQLDGPGSGPSSCRTARLFRGRQHLHRTHAVLGRHRGGIEPLERLAQLVGELPKGVGHAITSSRNVPREEVDEPDLEGTSLTLYEQVFVVKGPGQGEPMGTDGRSGRPSSLAYSGRSPLGQVAAAGQRCCADRSRAPSGDLWCSLECTPACQAGGRGFKSRQVRSRGGHGRSVPVG